MLFETRTSAEPADHTVDCLPPSGSETACERRDVVVLPEPLTDWRRFATADHHLHCSQVN